MGPFAKGHEACINQRPTIAEFRLRQSPGPSSIPEMERQGDNHVARRLKQERPTCRAKHNRSSRVRMEGWRQW
jgi:hypothetical protein